MASTRTLLRSLQQLERSPSFRLAVARSQSTWVTRSKRSRGFSSANPIPRPIVNGKSVAFHVNDLKTQKQFATSTLPPSVPQKKKKPIRDYDSDLVVVLDMDECLIHSQFLQGPGAKYAHQVRGANGSWQDESSVDTFNISLPDGELVRIHERPYLHEFLKKVSEKYETHIFTAAMEVYAKPVLKKLDPHGTIFTNCWYRESCILDPEMGAYAKSLDFAWGGDQLKRTVLVDNNPLSFLANPENGILVSSFYNDAKDTTLSAVIDLLDDLDSEEDVRPVLDARFGLKRALNELSKGRPFAARQQQLSVHRQESKGQQPPILAAASS
jgi:Dullard-like phosphatase family protein